MIDTQIRLQVDPELRFFLRPESRRPELRLPVQCRRSVKDFLESIGIPHVEIGEILVNGRAVDFGYTLTGGETVAVAAPTPPVDPTLPHPLRPQPLPELRFLCDVHLGRLTHLLRLLGFDTAYRNHLDDDQLVRIAVAEGRVLLTRDRLLLKRAELQHGYWLRETRPRAQLREISHRYGLERRMRPFTRCIPCNGLLEEVDKQQILDRLPENTAKFFDEFYRCARCGRIYWPGSHYEKLRQVVREIGDFREV